MKIKNSIAYLAIIFGGAIAIYANAEKEQNIYLLILGICVLMFGVFRLNSTLPSKDYVNKNYFTGETQEEE